MRQIFALAALSSIALATPAQARNGSWYVGGDFGGIMLDDLDFDFGPIENAVTLDHDVGFDGALFVGYDLGAFRLEAEVAYKRASVDSITSTIDLPGGAPGERDFPDGAGKTTALSFMINGMLDFGDENGLSGFVGAGAGMARVKVHELRVFDAATPFVDEADNAFAWQLVAGGRYAISDNIDLTLRYRFFNADVASRPVTLPEPVEGTFRSHSLLGGITFNFGESSSQ